MHWTLALIALAVAWASAAWWRPVSLALALSWVAGQLFWMLTGDQTPIAFYLSSDLAVIAVGLVASRCLHDRLIIGLFVFAWATYAVEDEVTRWWLLWGIMLLQLFIAGPWKSSQPIKGVVSHGSIKQIKPAGAGE